MGKLGTMKVGVTFGLAILVASVTAWFGVVGASKPPPSFNKVKQAIESTGVTLCNLSQPGNLTERLFGISTTGDCPGESGGGIVYIFTETTQAAAHSDLAFARNNAKTNGDSVWVDHTIIVDDESAAPGTNTALKAIGFKRG